jgi:hypothetical protein
LYLRLIYISSMTKTFRKFVEEAEKSPLISSMQDMLGIDPDDLKNEPQQGTFYLHDTGKSVLKGTNLGSYKIVEFKRDKQGKITHAVVRPMSSDKTYKDENGKITIVPGSESDKQDRLVGIEDLDGLLGQDLKSNQPA